MIHISKEVYADMYKLGFIKLTKDNSNCTTTSRTKNAKRKKKWICEGDYKKYIWHKNKKR